MGALGKTASLQFFVSLGYAGHLFFGVVQAPEGPSVQDAVLARLRRGCQDCVPFAVNFAARTDRGVHAEQNWLSFRVRPCAAACAARLLRALQTPVPDGLREVRAQTCSQRLMARNCTASKHYRYRLAVASADDRLRLGRAAEVLTGTVMVGRLAMPSAVCGLADWARPGVRVQLGPAPSSGEATVDVFGPNFLRRQVRYMVAAMQAVQRGDWSVDDLQFVAQGLCGPLRAGLRGPAAASGLTLVALTPRPEWRQVLGPVLGGAWALPSQP